MPMLVVTWVAATVLLRHWRESLPAREDFFREPLIVPLGKSRWFCFTAVVGGLIILIGIPLGGLLAQAGTARLPHGSAWDGWLLIQRLWRATTQQGVLLLQSGLLGTMTGGATALIALLTGWLMRDCAWFARIIWLIVAGLLAVPGPVLGIGLLTIIEGLLDLPGGGFWRMLLWDQPSPVPNAWICTLRFLPLALVVTWPLVRLMPRGLEEAAAIDGLGPLSRFIHVVLPIMRGPLLWVIAGVGVLTLGELSASKLVTTPGYTPFAHHVFIQMHSGADADLAALCLTLLLAVAIGAGVVVWLTPRLRSATS
jgi:ABC-type Fe3+ transport system permease subunit